MVSVIGADCSENPNRIWLMEFKKPHLPAELSWTIEHGQVRDIIPFVGLGVFFLARISGDVKGQASLIALASIGSNAKPSAQNPRRRLCCL
jgi:hypothetical protein